MARYRKGPEELAAAITAPVLGRAWRQSSHHGPGRRSWFARRLSRGNNYGGDRLRAIRAARGVGRPPRAAS